MLRRKPPGKLLPSAHAVDREYRVITALGRTDVPVPRTYVLCEDDAVIGTAFYVMDCVHGRIFSDPALLDVTPSRAHGHVRFDERRPGAPAHGRSRGDRARRLRAAGQLFQPADPPVDAAVPRVRDRALRLDGAPDRVAARAPAGGRHHHALPRRLPAGQPHLPSHRAARGRRARLGALHARPSAGRSRLLRDALSPGHRVGRLPRQGSQGARHPERAGLRGRLLSPRRSSRTSPTGTGTSSSVCSASPPSPRASWDE